MERVAYTIAELCENHIVLTSIWDGLCVCVQYIHTNHSLCVYIYHSRLDCEKTTTSLRSILELGWPELQRDLHTCVLYKWHTYKPQSVCVYIPQQTGLWENHNFSKIHPRAGMAWVSKRPTYMCTLQMAYIQMTEPSGLHLLQPSDSRVTQHWADSSNWALHSAGAICSSVVRDRKREMFYLTTHSTHFIYGYMASDIWLRTTQIVRKETRWVRNSSMGPPHEGPW